MIRKSAKLNRIIYKLLLLIGIFVSINTKADNLEWLAEDYDFGAFHEISGPQEGFVKFINRGESPTVITRVRPSCGCTGASYTEGLIMPGDTATISFTYNPEGRPGRFEKTVKVFTGKDNKQKIIKIRGTVIGAPATLEKDYPYHVGDLRISERIIAIGDIKYGQTRHRFVKVYNAGNDTLRPVVKTTAAGLEVSMASDCVAPGEVGTISLYLNTRRASATGLYKAAVDVYTDSESRDSFELEYSADILPDVAAMTPEELLNSPCCEVKNNLVELKSIKKDKDKDFEIKIHNTGGAPLVISEIVSDNDIISIKRFPRVIPAGKKGVVTCVLHTDNIYNQGAFRLPVEIHSDDVRHPVVTVNVVGYHNNKN